MKAGDVVMLVTGGLPMTVADAGENSAAREVECVWFDKDDVLHREMFPIESLKETAAP